MDIKINVINVTQTLATTRLKEYADCELGIQTDADLYGSNGEFRDDILPIYTSFFDFYFEILTNAAL